MSMNTRIRDIYLGQTTINLNLKNNKPYAYLNNQEFSYLWFLVDKVPQLSEPHYLREFCEISNFFWKGVQFEFIDSIQAYQQQYIERIEMEYNNPADIFPYRLTDFAIFDISVMHEPKIEGDMLSFYVYNVTNGLPYCVICPYPYPVKSTQVHYQILPLLK